MPVSNDRSSINYIVTCPSGDILLFNGLFSSQLLNARDSEIEKVLLVIKKTWVDEVRSGDNQV